MELLGKDFHNDELAGLRTIIVPSGIGEFQWAWTKYLNTGEDFAILGLDGAPRRLHQFCALHPQIKKFGYTGKSYTQIREFQKYHNLISWEAISDKFGLGQPIMLACNPHLESGRPLAEWLPDLPTTYSYDLLTTVDQHFAALQYLHKRRDEVLIGLSLASYRGAEAWSTWQLAGWQTFLKLVTAAIPGVRFALLGGSWDDLTAALFDQNEGEFAWVTNGKGFPPVGRTDFGTAVEILKGLDGYIGFSSGLGHVAAHCCGTPVAMLWPEHERALSTTWVDPTLLASGKYVPAVWDHPEAIFEQFEQWLWKVAKGEFNA